MRPRHLSTSTLVALLVAAAPIMAQGVSTQLGGRVLDATGAAVAGATVVIRNAETGLTRTVQSSSEGRYMATLLPVGPYTVTVTKAGFQTASNLKISLNLGDAAPLVVRLAAVSGAVVEVVAGATQVDSERASAAAIISTDNLANLPVMNRSFTSLATLAPQVVVESNRGNLAIAGQRGVNTSINIDGGDNNEPFFGGAIGAAESKAPFTISMEAIREYQVVTDGASAEFGRMGGGYVNAITKNGTNQLSGSLFYYTRPKAWVEPGPTLLQPTGSSSSFPVGDFKQEQFGFSAGGPIIKDKLFYFVTYDAQRKTSPTTQIWGGNSGLSASAGGPLVATNAYDAILLSKGGNYSSPENSDAFFARLDWNITPDQTLQLRMNHSKYTGDTAGGVFYTRENVATDNNTTDTYVLQWTWVINANWMNEFRVNYAKDDMPRVPYATTPQVAISNVGNYGAYPFDRTYSTKRTQFQENISFVTPTVQVKAGLDYNDISVSEFFAGNWRGVYNFSNLNNFRTGTWSTYVQNFGLNAPAQEAGLFAAKEKQMAAFIQADVRLGNTLKVGLGVRWDKQENPDFPILDMSNRLATTMPVTAKIPTDKQISPRLSFTWTPAFDQGKTVLRGSVGRYVSTTPAVFLYQAFAANGIRTGQVTFQPNTFGIPIGAAFNPSNPYWFPAFPTGAATPKFNIWTFSPDFKNPHTDRANLGFERPFFRDLVVGLSATYAKGVNLERTADVNLGAPTANAYNRLIYPSTVAAVTTSTNATTGVTTWSGGGFTPVRPNTNYGLMGMYLSDATSRYHAYTLSLKYHKDDSVFDAQLYYTYAINKDTDSNERNYSGVSLQDAGNLAGQWGYADTDRRSILTGYISFLEKDLTGVLSSLSMRYQTGTPYTLTYGSDVNGDGLVNDRYFANGVDSGRNTRRAGNLFYMDLGLRREFVLSKRIKMTASVDIFNLLNRQDTYVSTRVSYPGTGILPVTGVVPSTVDVNYAKNLTTQLNWIGAARQVQVGARFSF